MYRKGQLTFAIFAVSLLAAASTEELNVTNEAQSVVNFLGDLYRTSSSYYRRVITPVRATHELLYKARKSPKTDCKQEACNRVCVEEGCSRSFCHSRNDLCYCGGCKVADLVAITKNRASPVDYLSRPLEDCTPEQCYVDCREQNCKDSWCAFGSSCLCLLC